MCNYLLLYLNKDEVAPANESLLRELLPEYNLLVTRNRDQIIPLACRITIAAGWLTVGLLHQLPNVEWLHHWAAGIEVFITDPEIMKRQILLTNGSGIHGAPVSEHVFAYILAFARELPAAMRAQLHQRWSVPPHPMGNTMFDCAGKTILIIGYGSIGQHIAKIAKAFDMQVIGLKRDISRQAEYADVLIEQNQLHSFLPEADFVVLAAPLTVHTEGMIGSVELQLMKPSAYLINIGRGQLIRENDLVHALQEGWIAGAGLDVFEQEPLPADSLLWNMENVIITAHYAGNTPAYNEKAMEIFIENVKKYINYEEMINLVDWKLGY